MIFLGYLVCIAYVFFLIYLIGPVVGRVSNLETSRKTIHTMLFFVWVLIDLFFKDSIHQVILPIIFIVLNTLSYKFKLYKSVERDDKNDLGTIFFAVAITIILGLAYLYPVLYIPSGIAVFCLTFGDGFAALIGFNFKSRKIKDKKSVLGFVACFVFSMLSLLAFCAIWEVPLGFVPVLVISAFAAILELAGKGMDNFTVSLGTFLVSYCLLAYGSYALTISLVLALVVFFIVFFAKAIDYAGSVMAMVIVFSFAYFGKTVGIVYLLLAYFTIFAISVLKKRHTGKHTGASRGFLQILINGACGTFFVILYGITKNTEYLVLSVGAIGGCFVDSVSSDVGAFSRGDAYDPICRRSVPKGLSGGISWLGCVASLAASVAIAAYTFFFVQPQMGAALVVFGMCLLQTVLDTVLGSTAQVKYACPVCGTTVEEKHHCDAPTVPCSGVRWIDNNMVNAMSSVAISLIGWLLLTAV